MSTQYSSHLPDFVLKKQLMHGATFETYTENIILFITLMKTVILFHELNILES